MTLFGDGPTIVAEVGSTHDGNLETALASIDAAARAGADIVKFQSFLADSMLAPDDPNYGLLKQLEMPRAWYPQLLARCAENGATFLSTATNLTTMDWMEAEGVAGYKVASGNITLAPIIDRLVEIGKPAIVSTGAATLDETIALANRLSAALPQVAFLHCVARYPTPIDEMRLGNIEVLRRLLPCPVGLSDHSLGTTAAVAAVALGARIIEKHFSLRGRGVSPDHDVSLAPERFAELCCAVRDAATAMTTDFTPNAEAIRTLRRSLHFARDLPAGHVLTADDVTTTRPEDGLPLSESGNVVGRALADAVAAGAPLSWSHFQARG